MAKRLNILPKAAMARLLKENGAKRVSEAAMVAMADVLEKKGLEISRKAIRNAQHAGRKTVLDSDIKLALKE